MRDDDELPGLAGLSAALRSGAWVPTEVEAVLGAEWLALDPPVRPEPPRQAYGPRLLQHLVAVAGAGAATERLLATATAPADAPMVRLLTAWAAAVRPLAPTAERAVTKWEAGPVDWPNQNDPAVLALGGQEAQRRVWEERIEEWEAVNLPDGGERLDSALAPVRWVPDVVSAAVTGGLS
ncbi:hypothetical protein [Streptomyces otsuchiensis]|uniref:hypothetical protein n=1 Tax=Streptomyces otsuchiensis TaxID=2681388 RepID=UPI001031CE18|nr:hypothetical protein [Streptomyces otsuchiensis]